MTEKTDETVEVFEFPAKEARISHYELTILVAGDYTDEAAKAAFEAVKKLLVSLNAEITNELEMGRRTLAYTVAGSTSGNYFVVEFDANTQVIPELNEKLRITKEITRHMFVKRAKRTAEQIAEEDAHREERLSKARKSKEENEGKNTDRRGGDHRKSHSSKSTVNTVVKAEGEAETDNIDDSKFEKKKSSDKKAPLKDIDSEIDKLLSDDVEV